MSPRPGPFRTGKRLRSAWRIAGRSVVATSAVVRRSVTATIGAIHGPLVLLGATITLVQAIVLVAASGVVTLASTGTAETAASSLATLVVVVTLPLYVSLYAAVDEGASGLRETRRTAVRAVRTHYRRVLVADLTALGVAVVGGGLALAAWIAADATVQSARYALVSGSVAGPSLFPTGATTAFLVGFFVTALIVRFADAFVLFGDARPGRAWRWSVRFVRSKPPIFVGYVCLVTAVAAATAVVAPGPPDAMVLAARADALGFALASGTLSVTVAGAFHATFYRLAVEPSVDAAALEDRTAAVDR